MSLLLSRALGFQTSKHSLVCQHEYASTSVCEYASTSVFVLSSAALNYKKISNTKTVSFHTPRHHVHVVVVVVVVIVIVGRFATRPSRSVLSPRTPLSPNARDDNIITPTCDFSYCFVIHICACARDSCANTQLLVTRYGQHVIITHTHTHECCYIRTYLVTLAEFHYRLKADPA